jgi:hypothetical protein
MSVKDEGYWAESELWAEESEALKKELDETQEVQSDRRADDEDDNEGSADAGGVLPNSGV